MQLCPLALKLLSQFPNDMEYNSIWKLRPVWRTTQASSAPLLGLVYVLHVVYNEVSSVVHQLTHLLAASSRTVWFSAVKASVSLSARLFTCRAPIDVPVTGF